MAKKTKKTVKKSTKSSAIKNPNISKSLRTKRSKRISFVIGAVTVAILALLVFVYSQNNNYKNMVENNPQTIEATK